VKADQFRDFGRFVPARQDHGVSTGADPAGSRVAAQPTAIDGPGLGGRYTVTFSAGSLSTGHHTFDVRVYSVDGSKPPVSALKDVTVT